MKELTTPQIAHIVTQYPGCKKMAVENFLMTVHHNDTEFGAYQNMKQDARVYGWNKATQDAIEIGIGLSAGR